MRPTLFEYAGGEAAFLALARAHHARCLADPVLNHPFSHDDQHPQHVERLAAYWAAGFRAAMRGYMRWAVDNVLSYSAEGAIVASGIGMPGWDWNGLQT